MTFEEFRQWMCEYRCTADKEGCSLKDSYYALEELCRLYLRLSGVERDMADRLLAEWALSEDETLRFDALALIIKFNISAARQSLRQLARRLRASGSPGAPYELEKVERILGRLGG